MAATSTAPGTSLARRVAATTAIAAGLGAAVAAFGAGLLAHRVILAREDARLTASAELLAGETGAMSDERARSEIDEEAGELGGTGLSVAVFRGATHLGGADVPAPPGPGCTNADTDGDSLRACTVKAGPRLLTVASDRTPIDATRNLLFIAALAGVLVAAAGAAAASRGVARWAVGPLARLRADVAKTAPGTRAALGPAEGVEEVDALRTAIADTLARLEDALLQAQRFAADAAHELRTPLAALRAELELAAERPDDHAGQREALASAEKRAVALATLVERLLILATPATSAAANAAARGGDAVALADVVNEAVEALPPARRSRVARELPHADDAQAEGLVRGDAVLLRALVDNALDNALKFDPAGAVRLGLGTPDDEVVLTISDTGPGIPPADRERVFEPFFRTPSARAGTAGHGIGLALVGHVARSHGGSARFLDTDRGARLEVRLPRWRPR